MEKKSDTPTTESPRKGMKAELRVYYGPSQKMVLYGFSVDMSSGGLFLKTETPFSFLAFTSAPLSSKNFIVLFSILKKSVPV